MAVQRLQALVKNDFDAVNHLILTKVRTETGLIDDLASHIIESGGKRLRPLTALLTSRACQYDGPQHITIAAMLEFFHTATLLHDDVIDESKMRRGRQTANEIWGDKISILVGDYLLTQYTQMMVSLGNWKILELLSNIAYQMSRGEIKQLENRHKDTLTEVEYLEVIRAKTSLLFAASACLGGLIANVGSEIEQGLYDYGLHLGNAFQLIDDALDYCADAKTIGKNVGDDLADGIPTLPLLYAMKHGSIQQRELIKQTIKEGSLHNLPAILIAIEETRAIEYTRQLAKFEVDKAITALQILPDSVYKTALIDLAHYAIERDH